jgi:serine/threonine protein kinase
MWNQNTGNPVVLMDYHPHPLDKYLEKMKLDSVQLIDLCYQTAMGIAALHHLNITHRDIKDGNILVSVDGKI